MLAGEDAQLFATRAEGGAGAIAASAHLRTPRFVHVLQLMREGRLAEARSAWQTLQPVVDLVFAEPNPGPLKAALAHEGAIHDALRLPMTPASAALRARLRDLQVSAR